MSDPTAAVYAAGFHKQEGELRVIVFDLGSSTFDITMIQVDDGTINVEGHANINNLGGDNLDEALADYCIEEFSRLTGTSLNKNDLDYDQKMPQQKMDDLRDECEKAKRQLQKTL